MKLHPYRVAGEGIIVRQVETPTDLADALDWFGGRPLDVPVAIDTETTGLAIFSRGFRCRVLQLGTRDEAYTIPVERLGATELAAVRHALHARAAAGRTLVAHNAPYDLLVLDRVGLADLDVLGPAVFDTYVLAHLLDPRSAHEGGTGLGLKPLSAIYVDPDAPDTGAGLHEVFRRELKLTKETGWAKIDLDHPTYQLYAGLDVIYTSRLLRELTAMIRGSGLGELARFEHRVQLLTTGMQKRGLRIDVGYTQQLSGELEHEGGAQRERAAAYGVANVSSTRQVTAALEGMGEVWPEKTDGGAPAVGKEVLLRLADLDKDWKRLDVRTPNGLADAVLRAKRADKWRTSYVEPFLNDRDGHDRIHPSIRSLAARTARMSVSNPPLQQLPSGDWTIRRAVVADPGHVIVAADYSAVEMRVLAAVADVSRMKVLIAEGADLHTETARMVYGDAFDSADGKARKRMRALMKVVGFGKVYGGGATGLARQSGLPYDAVKGAVDAYDRVYPEIKAYGRGLQRTAEYGGHEVVTPYGRHLPLDRDRSYAATNYVVQSTARDVLADALCRIDDAGMSDFVLLPVHDEVIAQAPEAEAADVAHELGRLMETTFQGVFLAAEPEVYGPSWGSGYGCSADGSGACQVSAPHPFKVGVSHPAGAHAV